MTPYAQALARIEHNQKHNTGWLDDNDFVEGKVNPFYAALKDVLELHKPDMLPTGAYPYGSTEQYESEQCSYCRVDWLPCPTADLIISGVLGE